MPYFRYVEKYMQIHEKKIYWCGVKNLKVLGAIIQNNETIKILYKTTLQYIKVEWCIGYVSDICQSPFKPQRESIRIK